MNDTTPTARLLDDGHVEWTHLCVSGVVVAILPNTEWTVVSTDPLKVTPSVGCGLCDWHGWIDNGACWPPYPTAKAREAVSARESAKEPAV
ncbi:hypothetical protein K1W54_04240 [Micromonospora sp. CPCC 205371]|nr:hypothetical protein [Micromonospora sp. CPCC 205371]